ncbi:Inorganic pyrophosphatase [Vairimorpha necatrix]|uniref:inorganic diphosphatase n=1 Tax=Vairimorpha necatrix TaxID=6039 RepID=A0AAX4JDV2_9MICR
MKEYSTHTLGTKYTTDYTVYVTHNDKIISPFHSIDLFQHEFENVVTVINEIPRFENGKFEIIKDISLNPIKQDTKKGNLRFVENIFPFKGYMWNYGALPQTWEDKDAICGYTQKKGDNDPLDVLDFSSIQKDIGEVYQGKILGCLAMIDDNECDWKIVVIDVKDPLAEKINTSEDIEKYFPNYIESTIHWFKNYKIPDGKPENTFGLHGKFMDKHFTLEIIKTGHGYWKKLMESQHVPEIKYEREGALHDNNQKTEKNQSGSKSGYYFLKN